MAGALIALPVAANAMTLAEFLAKADALKAKGMLAMMSPDLPVVRGEMKAASDGWRTAVDAARAKGRTDMGCPPPKGQAKVTSDMLMTDFAAIAPARRAKMTVKDAFYEVMRKRYPCK
jgi:hypothetical protein